MTDNSPSLRVRGYLFSRLWTNRCLNIVRAAHQGVWLGLLDSKGLQELTDVFYEGRSGGVAREDFQSRRFNLAGFGPFEEAAFENHFSSCETVLLGSAGGGRELLALAKRGLRVDAFECNPVLLGFCRQFAKAHGLSSRVAGARPNHVPDDFGLYDGAICGWGSYMHVVGRENRVRFLSEFREHVRPGGPILLSFFVRRDTSSTRLAIRIARSIRFIRRAECVEHGDSISDSFDRYFTEDEIRQELAEGGFEMVFYSEEGYGHAVGRARAS